MNRTWLLRAVTVAFAISIIHLGIAPHMRIAGVAAELPIGLAVAAGLAGGVERGALFGFAYGFVIDLFLFTPIGLSALVYGTVGWLSGHVFMDRVEESPMLASLAVGVGTALGLGGFAALGIALGEDALSAHPVGRIMVVAASINAVVAFGLMWLTHWMWSVDPLNTRRPLL